MLLVANLLRGLILIAAAVAIASDLPLAVFALAVAYSVVSTMNMDIRSPVRARRCVRGTLLYITFL